MNKRKKSVTYLAFFVFAMHLNHISQHLDLELLRGEVLHIQIDREPVLLQAHLGEVGGKRAGMLLTLVQLCHSVDVLSVQLFYPPLFC